MTVRELYEYAEDHNLLDADVIIRREDPDWDYNYTFDYPIHVCTHETIEEQEQVMLIV